MNDVLAEAVWLYLSATLQVIEIDPALAPAVESVVELEELAATPAPE
jgi:hypothetical protein